MPPKEKHQADDDRPRSFRAQFSEPNTVWPVSTTWRSDRGRVARAPQATQDSRPQGVRFARLPRRDPREPLSAVVKWRGGPEGWIEVRARGAVVRVPGYTSVAELVLLLNSHV